MRKLIGLSLLSVVSLSHAANAPVEDLGTGASSSPVQGAGQAASSRVVAQAPQNQALTDLHFEVQSLRDEVRELRGVVEEQGNELRHLKQRQLDDYQDLDRRLSAVRAGEQPTSSTAAVPSGPQMSSTAPQASASDTFGVGAAPSSGASAGAASSVPGEGEYEAYTATYNLLKARKIDEAVAGFKQFVAKFPNGQYTANAYYWLGEIYMLQNDLGAAENAFATVKNRFPAHRKANDAKFKLAKVYHLEGKNEQARALLNEVAATNSSASALAKAYLRDNFQ